MTMNRWKASGIHFLISLVVFCFLLSIILLVWYPGLLFQLNGGWEGLRIVIGVDLVLGPLLTLIVYKEGKPSLKFDLTSIAIFQSLCLAAGVWMVYEERPVVLAFEYDTIYSLSAREFKDYGNEMDSLEDFAGKYPRQVFLDLPADDSQALDFAFERQFNGSPLYAESARYRPLPQDNNQLIRNAENFKVDAVAGGVVPELPAECLLARFVSSSAQGYVCIDSATREISEFYEPID